MIAMSLMGAPGATHGSPSMARWLAVWTRAVIAPAWRRAVATWIGCAIVGAVIFGPTAMRPADLTGLALHDPGVGLVLGGTWLLVFVPTARVIVRPAVGYLASLPGNPRAAWLVGALALVGLQLPWLLLWIIGEGATGAGVVAATTLIVAGLARWQPPRRAPRMPAWRDAGRALRAIHVRALGRRAGDALVRGAGISVLAGIAGGLLVRNNELTGEPAGVLAASVIAVVLVPAHAGAGLVALATHRETAWLAASSGISRATRIAALVYAVAIIHVGAAVIAAVAAMAVAGGNAWLPALAAGTALATALGVVRAMLVHEASPSVAARVTTGAVVAAAIAVVCLSVLDAAGVAAAIALGGFGVLVVKP